MNKFLKQLLISAFLMLNLMGISTLAQDYPKAILSGDYPDPSIIRDGSDYYMTNTSTIYYPGYLIWHSKDLINWEPVCRALTNVVGDAIAPDLVKFKDKYYIYFSVLTATNHITNWVIWADNIRGPWSKPIDLKIKEQLIDPGHIVDNDGKRYLILGWGNMIPISDDGLSVTGEMRHVYDGWIFPKDWVTEGLCAEGPKMIKKGDYFYLNTAEGGTAGPPTSHMVVSARSKNLFGPYENSPYNPIIHTYSADEPWWSKGHGTLIDDVNGNWWIVYHAYKNGFRTLGRHTLIEPVEWTTDGWFKSAKSAKPIVIKGSKNKNGMELSDNFRGKTLGLQWFLWRSFEPENVTLKENSLYLSGKGTNPKDARLLLNTATDESYEIQVEVTLSKGSIGGLLLFYNEKAYAGIYSDGNQFTICENAEKQTSKPNELGSHFFVKIVNNRNICDILVSNDKRNWKTIYSQLNVSELHHNKYGDFLALRPCLMAAGSAEAKFNEFVYKPQKKN